MRLVRSLLVAVLLAACGPPTLVPAIRLVEEVADNAEHGIRPSPSETPRGGGEIDGWWLRATEKAEPCFARHPMPAGACCISLFVTFDPGGGVAAASLRRGCTGAEAPAAELPAGDPLRDCVQKAIAPLHIREAKQPTRARGPFHSTCAAGTPSGG